MPAGWGGISVDRKRTDGGAFSRHPVAPPRDLVAGGAAYTQGLCAVISGDVSVRSGLAGRPWPLKSVGVK